jgi:two-component system, NtrC family, nitrogen regulation sensor histidine kinase GlnL
VALIERFLIDADGLASALIGLDADGRIGALNGVAESVLNVSARRAQGLPIERALSAEPVLAARVRAAFDSRQALRAFAEPWGRERVDVSLLKLPASALPLIVLLELRVRPAPLPSDETERQRALLRAVGHEVKNQLTDLIAREVDRLSALIDRWGETSTPTHRRALNVHEPLEHVHRLLAAEMRGRVVIERDYDVSLPTIQADLNRLIQALINLLRNADQAGAKRIVLRSRPAPRGERAVCLSVLDNGRGVPHSLRERIFEPLVTGRAEGLGLGLSIVSAVAAEHHGRIELNSRPGETEFTLTLPID